MIKNIVIITLILFRFYGFGQNFVATYSFANVSATTGSVDPSVPPLVNGLACGAFIYFGPASNPNASGRFSFTNWPVGAVDGDDNYGNYTAVLSPTVYYQVSLRVVSGHTLNLTSISFAVRRSGTGVRNYVVRSNRDNFNNNLAAATGTNTKLSVIPGDTFFWNYDSISSGSDQKGSRINLSGQFSGITDSLTFRFYAWNSESTGGTFSIDNVSLSGSVLDSLILTSAIYTQCDRESIQVYPNPSNNGRFIIKNGQNNTKFQVLTLLGEECIPEQEMSAEEIKEFNLLSFASGNYILKSRSGGIISYKRLIVSRIE